MTPTQRKHLKTAIARLRREIKALQAKPKPQRANYADARFYKKAITTRTHAIAQRHLLIADYTKRLQ
jgi:septal ring factor EnvC (AmiA/AmiB activator)